MPYCKANLPTRRVLAIISDFLSSFSTDFISCVIKFNKLVFLLDSRNFRYKNVIFGAEGSVFHYLF